MKNLKKWIFFLSFAANASVNVKNASFQEAAIEWTTQNFELTRQYSSKSLHNGIFGFGWCSSIERSLTADPLLKVIKVRHCDREELFHRQKPTMEDGLVYTRSGTDEIILIRGDKFVLKAQNHLDIFDLEGRWVARDDHFKIDYDVAGKAVRISAGAHQAVHLTYENDRVANVHSAQFETLFTYEKLDLVSVKSARQTVRYQYDEMHNLTKIHSGDKVQTMIYDEKTDRIAKVMDGACIERYSYLSARGKFETNVATECPGRKPLRLRYEFVWLTQNEVKLTKMSIASGYSELLADYDSEERLKNAVLKSDAHRWNLKFNILGEITKIQGRPDVPVEPVLAALRLGGSL